MLTVLLAVVAPGAAAAATFGPAVVYGQTGAGMFRFPQAVAYDDSGVADPGPDAPPGPYVYVADNFSFLVQKFAADGRFVRQWGGYGSDPGHFGNTGGSATATTGTIGGIGGIAVHRSGDVYVLDSFNQRIEQFTPGGTFVRAFGGLGSAPGRLDTGINGGLAIEGDRLYVADQDNHRVQRFALGPDGAPDGAPLVFGELGSGDGELDHPQGVAVDPAADHDVFVADDRNHRVQRFSADGAYEAQVGAFGTAPGEFRFPYDVGVDRFDRLYVADNNNHRVQRFAASTLAFQATWSGFGTAPEQLGFPRSLAALAATDAGGVYVGDTSNDRIDEFSAGGVLARSWGDSGRAAGRFTLPRSVAPAPDGTLVVADTRTDRVERLRADGTVAAEWGKRSSLGYPTPGSGPGEFLDPGAVAIAPDGDVWVAEGGNHRVQRLPADGGPPVVYGGTAAGEAPGEFKEPLGIAVGPGAEVLVADTRNDRVQRLDPVTGAWSVLPVTFARPAAVTVDAQGRRYVAEAAAGRVRVLGTDGTVEAAIDGLDAPEGVAVDAAGAVIVADTGRHRVLRYVRDGAGYRLAATLGGRGDAPGELNLPTGVATDVAGSIYVADTYNNRLQAFPAEAVAPPASAAQAAPPPSVAPPPPAAAVRARPLGVRLLVRPRRDRRRPYVFTARGRILLPLGASPAAACRGRVAMRAGRLERVARVRADCRFAMRLRVTRRGRLRVGATFRGNAALAPRAARTVRVRAG